MKRKILAVCIATIMVSIMPLNASSLSNKKNELEDTKQTIKNSKNQLAQIKSEKDQLEKEVDALDQKIIAAENKLLTIESDLENKKEQVETAKKDLEEAMMKKKYQYEATKDRMVQMYKNKKTGYIELVFSSGSLPELLNRAQYIKVISQYDNQLLDEYEKQEEIIAEKKKILESEQVHIEKLYANQEAAKVI